MVMLLFLGWSEFVPIIKFYWLLYIALIGLSLYVAQAEHNSPKRRLRGPVANLGIVFGFPLGIFIGAMFDA